MAVSIDYRLFDVPLFPPPSAIQMQEVIIKSASDMKGVIRHIRQDAATDNNFRIDPNMIFTSGISARAIAASYTAALDSTDIYIYMMKIFRPSLMQMGVLRAIQTV